MKVNFSLSIHKITAALVLIALYLAVQSITGKYIEAAAGTEQPHILSELVRLFNINRESSLPTWYASSLLLGCAGLLGLVAHIKHKNQEPYRNYWRGLAFIFLYMSIDEAAAIHERLTIPIQEALNTSGPMYFAWMVVGIPLVIVFGLVYFRFWLNLPPRTRKLFLLSGVIYIGGAVGVEMIGSNMWYEDGGSSLIYSTIGTIEEFFEMLGAATLIYTLLTYLAGDAAVIEVQMQPAEQAAVVTEKMPEPTTEYPPLPQEEEWEMPNWAR